MGLEKFRRRCYGKSTYSQGGVKVPTGGIPDLSGEPASAFADWRRKVSRSGETPEPTVTVRMEEDKAVPPPGFLTPREAVRSL